MKKLLMLMAVALIALLPSCSSEEPTVPQPFLTRADLPWYSSCDSAYDSFWEMVFENGWKAEYFSNTNWLPKDIYEQFVDDIALGGVCFNSDLSPDDSVYIVKEVLEYFDDGDRVVPVKTKYTLWCLFEGKVNGRVEYRYGTLDYGGVYIVEKDTYE